MNGVKINAEIISGLKEIRIPASKSISNRVLILNECRVKSGVPAIPLSNLSEAEDTAKLIRFLSNPGSDIEVGNSGTTLRFITPWIAATPDNWVKIDCGPRMKERPNRELFKVLIELGAEIRFLENEYTLPVLIKGKILEGKLLNIDNSESSQFISGLMMIGSIINNGITIVPSGKPVSLDYIEMTRLLMKVFGATVTAGADQSIIVSKGFSDSGISEFQIENDWSSAAFFYQAVALNSGLSIKLNGLSRNSVQGDSKLVDIMKELGVETIFSENDICIQYKGIKKEFFNYDFTNQPDLAPSVVCTLVNSGIPFHVIGLESLQKKECDRLACLFENLSALGYDIELINKYELKGSGNQKRKPTKSVYMHTYEDHRMVMCFAILGLVSKQIILEETTSISKSFPSFWNEVRKIGITLQN